MYVNIKFLLNKNYLEFNAHFILLFLKINKDLTLIHHIKSLVSPSSFLYIIRNFLELHHLINISLHGNYLLVYVIRICHLLQQTWVHKCHKFIRIICLVERCGIKDNITVFINRIYINIFYLRYMLNVLNLVKYCIINTL